MTARTSGRPGAGVLTPTLLACCATTVSVHVATIMLNTLLPFRLVELGGSKTEIGLLFSVMTVVAMVLRPLVGGWVDRFGVLRILYSGIAAFALTALVLQVASRPATVIASMVFLGLGNGLVSTTTSVLAARAGTPERRGEVLSLYYLSSSVAMAIAPPLAFGLDHLGRLPLVLIVVLGLVLGMVVAARTLPAASTASVPGAVGGFQLASRHVIAPSVAMALTTFGQSSIYGFLPLYAASHGHGGVVLWFFVLQSLCVIGGRAALRGVSDRVGRIRVALPAMAVTTAAFGVLALPPTPASLVVAAVLMGCGNSLLYPTLLALVVDRAPATERGLAMGTLSGAWDLGVVVGSALIGVVVDRSTYGAGFGVASGAAAAGLVVLALTERRRTARSPDHQRLDRAGAPH